MLDVGGGAESLEDPPRGVELHRGAVVVAHAAERERGEHADTRALVRRVELLPDRLGGPESSERGFAVTVRDQDFGVEPRKGRFEERGGSRFLRRRQRGNRVTCPASIPHRERDLSQRRQNLDPRDVVGRFIECSLDHRPCRIGPTACEQKQRQTWLRPATPAAAFAVRRVRGGELAPQSMQLTLFVVRLAHRRCRRRSEEPLLGLSRLFERSRPIAVEAHQRTAIDEASSAERETVGLAGTPVIKGMRPVLRPAKIEQVVERLDRAAVDDPGRERREFAGGHGDHRVIEERDTFGDLA